MRNSIAILAIISSFAAYGQFKEKDTLYFAEQNSYSRAIVRSGENLLFGTSKSGVVQMNEKLGLVETVFPASVNGEFRDVALDNGRIVAIVSGENGELIMRSGNAAETLLYREKYFFDALDLRKGRALVLADPVDGYFPLFVVDLATKESRQIQGPKPIGDEACYAASGTTVAWLGDSSIAFISGGSQAARFHRSDDMGKTWRSADLPLVTGEGCGPFSFQFLPDEKAVVVGGCYTQPQSGSQTGAYSSDGGKTWVLSTAAPGGYRSCVTGNKKIQYACGSTGIDISTDGGRNWKPFDKGNYCALLLEKKHLYATTNKGMCVRYRLK